MIKIDEIKMRFKWKSSEKGKKLAWKYNVNEVDNKIESKLSFYKSYFRKAAKVE